MYLLTIPVCVCEHACGFQQLYAQRPLVEATDMIGEGRPASFDIISPTHCSVWAVLQVVQVERGVIADRMSVFPWDTVGLPIIECCRNALHCAHQVLMAATAIGLYRVG